MFLPDCLASPSWISCNSIFPSALNNATWSWFFLKNKWNYIMFNTGPFEMNWSRLIICLHHQEHEFMKEGSWTPKSGLIWLLKGRLGTYNFYPAEVWAFLIGGFVLLFSTSMDSDSILCIVVVSVSLHSNTDGQLVTRDWHGVSG